MSKYSLNNLSTDTISEGHVDLGVYKNDWYNCGAGMFKRLCWYFCNELVFKSGFFPLNGLKIVFLRLFGAKVGKQVVVKPGVNIKYPWFLTIGNQVWIGEDVWIDNLAEVSIGNDVCISQGAMLLTGNHNFSSEKFDLIIGKIILESGCWIGAKSVVCPGVTCKTHAVLTVGSVANKVLEAYSINRGNPAVKIKHRFVK